MRTPSHSQDGESDSQGQPMSRAGNSPQTRCPCHAGAQSGRTVIAVLGTPPVLSPVRNPAGRRPWWLRGEEHKFDPRSARIPHALEQRSPRTTATEPVF